MALINKPDISKIWASTGSKVAPLDAKIATGWIQEMMPAEWENFLQNRTDVMLNHISQRGIPEWDAVTEYQAGRSYVTSSSGTVYRAVTTNTNSSPSSDSGTNWVKAFVTTSDVFVSSTGNIGIGTTPTSRLQVFGLDGGPYHLGLQGQSKGMRVIVNANGTLIQGVDSTLSTNYQPIALNGTTVKVGAADAELLTVSANGVGIGTGAPAAKLDITLTGSSGISQSLRTITAPSVVPAYALGAGIEFSWYAVAPSIRLAHGGDGNSAGLAFSTAFSGTTAERMRIDQVGNVGIGTSTPADALHITRAGGARIFISDTNGTVSFGSRETAGYSDLTFDTLGSVERMRITATGNVGIGISPATKFHASTTGADCEARIETITSGNPRLSLNASGAIYNWLQTNRSTGALEFAVNNTVVATLDGEGGFRLKYSAGGGGIGYGAGAGGAITQATSRTTGVTVNKPSGAITLFTAAGSATPTTFTVTNSAVAATDVVNISIKSATNIYAAFVTATNNGSFNVTFYSLSGTASDAPVINFAVLKSVAV